MPNTFVDAMDAIQQKNIALQIPYMKKDKFKNIVSKEWKLYCQFKLKFRIII
jgi:hypothetical protein